MGTSSHGNLGDYPAGRPESTGTPASEERDTGDICARRIAEVALEDVERCAFFGGHGELPPEGTDIVVVREEKSGRPAAATSSAREVVGLLPARYNYLVGCLESGYSYTGVVTVSTPGNPALVTVSVAPVDA